MAVSSILVSAQDPAKDSTIFNEFTDPRIFLNALIQHKQVLLQNAEVIEIDATYNFRPDKLAYEFYNQELWYPIILVANNLGSVMQFKPDLIGNKCIIPAREDVIKIVGKINSKLI